MNDFFNAALFFLTYFHFCRRQPRPPFFTKPLDDLHILATGCALLRCQVAGYPEPKIKWEFNDEVLSENDEERQLIQHGDICDLVIPNVLTEHQGEYHCIAENSHGVAHSSGYLSVGGENTKPSPPHFVRYD